MQKSRVSKKPSAVIMLLLGASLASLGSSWQLFGQDKQQLIEAALKESSHIHLRKLEGIVHGTVALDGDCNESLGLPESSCVEGAECGSEDATGPGKCVGYDKCGTQAEDGKPINCEVKEAPDTNDDKKTEKKEEAPQGIVHGTVALDGDCNESLGLPENSCVEAAECGSETGSGPGKCVTAAMCGTEVDGKTMNCEVKKAPDTHDDKKTEKKEEAPQIQHGSVEAGATCDQTIGKPENSCQEAFECASEAGAGPGLCVPESVCGTEVDGKKQNCELKKAPEAKPDEKTEKKEEAPQIQHGSVEDGAACDQSIGKPESSCKEGSECASEAGAGPGKCITAPECDTMFDGKTLKCEVKKATETKVEEKTEPKHGTVNLAGACDQSLEKVESSCVEGAECGSKTGAGPGTCVATDKCGTEVLGIPIKCELKEDPEDKPKEKEEVTVPDNICGPREKVLPDGQCEHCDDYYMKSKDQMSCVKPDCSYREVIVFDGTCSECPLFNVADEQKQRCVIPKCPDGWKVSQEGKCQECPPYTRSLKSNFRCDKQTCGLYQTLQEDGNCAEPSCESNEYVTYKGTCVACPEFMAPSGKKKCEEPVCALNEKVTSKGVCEKCGPYERVSANQRECSITMCDTKDHVLGFDGSCTDPNEQKRANAELQAQFDAKNLEVEGHLKTLAGIQKNKEKERYSIQADFAKIKAQNQKDQFNDLLEAYRRGRDEAAKQEEKVKVHFDGYEITEGVCADGLLKHLYESKVISFNYDFKIKHEKHGCAPETVDLGVTDTLDKCMKKYVDAVEAGTCSMEQNAVEFVPNEHCDCCGPNYELQTTDQDTNYDGYNIYQLLKNPVYLDGKPEVATPQKAEMEFCEQLCSSDPECTAFHYDMKKADTNDNCKLWTSQKYTGDGTEGTLCFVRKAAVDNKYLQIVKAKHFCPVHQMLSTWKDSLEECAEKATHNDNAECAKGDNHFFYRKSDKHCACCTDETAVSGAVATFDPDLNLYQRVEGFSQCLQKNCKTCVEGNNDECSECNDGYRLAFGSCFNFDY